MLVLSRTKHQGLQIGDDTTVTVTKIEQSTTTLTVTVDGKVTDTSVLQKNESIQIGDTTVVVVEIRKVKGSEKVRLGVEAPKEMPIHRREVFEAIRRHKPETENE